MNRVTQEWTVDEVGTFLQTVGFGKWASTFEEQEIDGQALLQLTDDDLREMKFTIGERKKFSNELHRLRIKSGTTTGTDSHHIPPTKVSTSAGASLDSGEAIAEMEFDYKNYPKTFLVSIPLATFFFGVVMLPCLYPLYRMYIKRQKATLTSTRLIVQTGLCNIIKKSIPLDKIQDFEIMHGCVDRCFNQVKVLVNTGDVMSNVFLLGPKNADEFRQKFLDIRNHMVLQRMNGPTGVSSD